MGYQDDPQVQTMIDNLPVKTGKTLAEWFAVLSQNKLEKHGEMLKLLKEQHGVSHGFANTIALLYREQAAGGPPAEDDLVAAQYAGTKAGLRPLYEAILEMVNQFGGDVEIAPKKAYVSLRRKKQFAIVQPSTKDRLDLGLNLKGVEATARLEGGVIFNGMCTHKVRLSNAADLDSELSNWLHQAYEQAG